MSESDNENEISNALISALQGEWSVTCYGGAAPMNLIGDSKRIDGNAGLNIMKGKEWGWFSITQDGDTLILNYDDKRNSWLLRHVRDRIKRDGDGWFGTFFFGGRRAFKFRLDRPDA